MRQLKNTFDPLHKASSSMTWAVYSVWIAATVLLWYATSSAIVPKPHRILGGIVTLFSNGFARDLMASLAFTFKAMSVAIAISFFLAFLYLIPAFRPLMRVVCKSRFLSTAGFTVVFAVMTPDTAHQKFALLVFCISVFQVVSFTDIMISATEDRIDYCRTMRFSSWRIVWEEMILAKRSDMLVSVRQNFAIAWVSLPMIETINRVDGGIGIVLEDLRRHFRYDQIFGVQVIVLLCGMGIDMAIEKLRSALFSKWAQ